MSTPRPSLRRRVAAGLVLLATALAAARAGELATATSGAPGNANQLVFQLTDDPITYFDAWQVMYGFEAKISSVVENHMGYTDLQHGQIAQIYGLTGPAQWRFFKTQKIESTWTEDPGTSNASINYQETIKGGLSLTLIHDDDHWNTITAGSAYNNRSLVYRDVTNVTDMYGTVVRQDYSPFYHVTDNWTSTGGFGMSWGVPYWNATEVFTTDKTDDPFWPTHTYAQTASADPFNVASWHNAVYWGAEYQYVSGPPPANAPFGSAPGQWTADTATWTSTSPNGTGGTYTFNYTLTLSDEDTKADEQARIDAETPLVALNQVPWGEHYYGYRGKLALTESADTDRMDLENYNDLDTYGDVREDQAIVRFNVPAELQIPGVAYRARVIETYYPFDYRQPSQIVGIQDVTMHAGAWTSPEIAIQPPVGDGYTEVSHFAAVAEEVAPHQILALAGLAAGTTPAAPAEYATTKPTLVTQPQITDTNGVARLSRRVLTGSQTLQQINLADDWSALPGLSGATANWSLVPGSTGQVRLWRWHDDGSALGQWFPVTPQDNLVPYYGSNTDFLFVEALSGGKSTVRITLTVAGQSVDDDIAIIAQGVQASLAVDANRDGTIDLPPTDGSAYADQTSADKPFRFWVNDDIDRGHAVDGNDYDEEDIGPTEAAANKWVEDWKYNAVQSKRDMEDFARILISVAGQGDAFRKGDLVLGLKWSNPSGTAAVKIYPQQDTSGGTSYLTDDSKAGLQLTESALLNQRHATDDVSSMAAHTVVAPGEVFILPASVWAGTSGDSLTLPLLFEGSNAGADQLQPVILEKSGDNYTEVGDGSGVFLDLRNIKDMYEHWTVGEGNGGPPDAAAGYGSSFRYTTQSPEDRQYILYVHGWNMEPWEKERYAETAYKRLYWQGYKGRFGLFSWPTTNRFDPEPPFYKDAATDPTNFDRGEFSAWRSGGPLLRLLQTLYNGYGGQLYVFAHSMGNVAVGEALRLAHELGEGKVANTYVATQAALAAQCYDGSWPDDLAAVGPLGISALNLGKFPETANIYPNWFSTNVSAVGTMVNFYNVNDYALWHDAWELNQYTKPDHPDLPDQPRFYGYVDDPTQSVTTNGFGFLKTAQTAVNDRYVYVPQVSRYNWIGVLSMGTPSNVEDRYEIMAFAAEARSKAMGAADGLFPATNSVNLQSIWPADPEDPQRPYSRHKWHSAEFRSTNMQQHVFWSALLGPDGFNLITSP